MSQGPIGCSVCAGTTVGVTNTRITLRADRFYDFHIHLATQRYQEIGSREDAYAEITDRYTDIDGAIQSMFEDAGFEVPPVDQPLLF